MMRPAKFVRHKHGTVGFLDASSHPQNRQSGVALTLATAVQNVACAVGISTSLGGLFVRPGKPKAALAQARWPWAGLCSAFGRVARTRALARGRRPRA